MAIYAKCVNGIPRISLTKPDDTWVELDGTLSDKVICKDGQPVLVSSLDFKKQLKLEQIKSQITSYIYTYYSFEKQQHDLQKKDFWLTWLLARRSDLTSDVIAKTIYDDAAEVLSGTTSFDEKVSTYPTTTYVWNGIEVPEYVAWKELLKVGIRTGWIRLVTSIYDQLENQIQSAENESDLESITIPDLPPWPEI